MKTYKFRLKSILFMVVVIIIFGVVFSFKRDITNKSYPKKATLVNAILRGNMDYE